MARIEITAVITSEPGKAERFLSLFERCAQHVEEYEPSTDRYELRKGIKAVNGKEVYVVFESYKDQESFEKHLEAPPMIALRKAIEQDGLDIIPTTGSFGIADKSERRTGQ